MKFAIYILIALGIILMSFISGYLLHECISNPNDSFISNLINFAVAAGTIGAVITSLYLNKISKKETKKDTLKIILFKGLEILDTLQHYQRLLIGYHNNDTTIDDELRNKINQFQWDIIFILNDSPECFELLYKISGQTYRIACLFLINFVKQNIDQACINNYDYIQMYNSYIANSEFKRLYEKSLTDKFYSLTNVYLNNKSKYRHLCSQLIKKL